jgi:septum formation protein
VVALDGVIMGKPVDRIDAAAMIARLSGRTHEVITAFRLQGPGITALTRHVSTEVEFRVLDRGEIERYASSGEPLDKAGAYAVQGRGGSLTRRITGSYTNVVGLPLAEVLEALASEGLYRPGAGPGG